MVKLLFNELFAIGSTGKGAFLFLLACAASFTTLNAQSEISYNERDVFIKPDSILIDTPTEINIIGSVDPQNFRVGPGDKIFISIQGLEEITFTRWIDHEGNLYLPSAGFVNIGGMTLNNAKKAIKELIATAFRNVDVYISLVEVRKLKVGLYGDVREPSSFIISANSRLSDLLEHSNGLKKSSDLRNIIIKHKNGTVRKVDMLQYLRLGKIEENPQLLDDDFVFIDKVDKSISITGEIRFPGVYEYNDEDNLQSIINLAGGLNEAARTDSIEIIRFSEDNKTQYSSFYNYENINGDIKLMNKDFVVVRQIPEYLASTVVYVKGFVRYPGIYNIEYGTTTLSDIIQQAGGFLKDASLIDAKVLRNIETETRDLEFERLKTIPRADMNDDEYDYYKAKSRERKGQLVVNFIKLFVENSPEEDLLLRNNDEIIIPQQTEYVTLIGQVVFPGRVPYDKSLTVDEYIRIAGGFAWRALENDVRIIRANTGEWIDADEGTMLESGDTIWVPEEPEGPDFWEVFRDTLFVLGQVATVVAAMAAVIASS